MVDRASVFLFRYRLLACGLATITCLNFAYADNNKIDETICAEMYGSYGKKASEDAKKYGTCMAPNAKVSNDTHAPPPNASGPSKIDRPTASTDPLGSSQEFSAENAEATQRAADAGQQRAQVEDVRGDLGKYESNKLISAQDKIRLSAKRVIESSTNASGPLLTAPNGMPLGEAVSHDAPIVKRAMAQYENEKPISLDDVSTAIIPEIRNDLLFAARAQTINSNLAKREAELTDIISGLASVASIAGQRDKAMSTAGVENGSTIAHISEKTAQGASGLVAPDAAASFSSKGEISVEKLKTIEEMEKVLADMKGPKVSVLRERLRKKLAAARAAKLAEEARNNAMKSGTGGDIFEGKLATVEGVDSTKGAGASLAAQAVDSALKSTSVADQPRFSLAGAETDAAVRKLMREPSADASIQSEESQSLFERIHSAHTNCLKNHCVN